ncbi:FAD-dependent monooxygenase [Streptomyces sp. MAR4 CNX-425]|uniref:FAD-dependent monooxygenase n=1 Tax=Streptomyces sp. MAR4 CNX-425 TaxID=3406343 RepID=UPI003B5139A0
MSNDQDRPTEDPVVVVGAGPCGLVIACELLRLGVPVRLLEADAEPHTGSRAVLLWPPTLDVLRGLGMLDDALARGVRPAALAYHMPDGKTLRVALGEANEPLVLPQQETTRLLLGVLEKLGGRVEYGVRVTGVETADDGVTLATEGPDGTGTVTAPWLIGADGVGSTVRQQLGVPFEGGSVPMTFVLAEGEVTGDFGRDAVQYFLGHKGAVLLSPLPGGLVRISGPVPPDMPMTREAVQRMLDERAPAGLRYVSATSIDSFTSQERIAKTLRSGRAFLAGDAAHVHSVVGGQGLNLGIQDGRNLAWKLAGVIHGTLSPAVLDSYTTERRAVAEQVVATTGRMIRQAAAGPFASRVRNGVWALMQATGTLRRWYAPMLAGHLTRYPDVLFGAPTPKPPRGLPAPGSRTPAWVPAADPGLDGGPDSGADGFRLLTLGPAGTSPLRSAAESLAARHPDVVTHAHVARRKAGWLLLRPDGFVAASGRGGARLAEVESLLARVVAGGA